MKKTGPVGASVTAPKDVDEYLAGVPEPARTTLSKVRASIRKAAPAEATEAISYGMPTFRYQGALLGYAAFKKHCSFFPMSLGVMAELKQDLAPYDVAKGTIHFPLDKPIPAALVKKLVKARVAEKARKQKR
jgi:uncharacterized protein YdhG (YjbR/CyaY superfamily)